MEKSLFLDSFFSSLASSLALLFRFFSDPRTQPWPLSTSPAQSTLQTHPLTESLHMSHYLGYPHINGLVLILVSWLQLECYLLV